MAGIGVISNPCLYTRYSAICFSRLLLRMVQAYLLSLCHLMDVTLCPFAVSHFKKETYNSVHLREEENDRFKEQLSNGSKGGPDMVERTRFKSQGGTEEWIRP